MPKDIQVRVDSVCGKDRRTTLRELAHIRRHHASLQSCSSMGIRIPQACQWNRAPTPAPAEVDVEMDNIESCLSSLSLVDSSKEPEQEMHDCEIEDVEVHRGPLAEASNPEEVANLQESSSGKGWSSETPRSRRLTMLAQEEIANVHISGQGCEAALCRRIAKLERRECGLKYQVKTQKRAIASLAEEAEGTRRLLAIAEEHFQEYERTVANLKDESNRYCRWWLNESRDLKDLLGFVADPNEPRVSRIASDSRARFVAFYNDAA